MIELVLKSLIKGIIYAVIATAAVWVLTTYTGHGVTGTAAFPAVPASKWQAVFLTGGQVYFGRLSDVGNGYVSLSNVYYLKSANELQQSNLNLVKLGGELHGPEDTIYIRKESISFWENMKDTSRVVQSIEGASQ
ncbi:MAG: hypothetical protein KBD06_02470 [Candidatus Pacebacteria bacterium]|nr:hypothetical protein [Candidatus Paceibacterota bacterium]